MLMEHGLRRQLGREARSQQSVAHLIDPSSRDDWLRRIVWNNLPRYPGERSSGGMVLEDLERLRYA